MHAGSTYVELCGPAAPDLAQFLANGCGIAAGVVGDGGQPHSVTGIGEASAGAAGRGRGARAVAHARGTHCRGTHFDAAKGNSAFPAHIFPEPCTLGIAVGLGRHAPLWGQRRMPLHLVLPRIACRTPDPRPTEHLLRHLPGAQGKQVVGSPSAAALSKGLSSYEQFQAVFRYSPGDWLPASGKLGGDGAPAFMRGHSGSSSPGHRARSVSPMGRSAGGGASLSSTAAAVSLGYTPKHSKDEQQLTPAQQCAIQFRSTINKSTSE